MSLARRPSTIRRRLVAGLAGAALVAVSGLSVATTAQADPGGNGNGKAKGLGTGIGNGPGASLGSVRGNGGIPWADLADPAAVNSPGVTVETMVKDVGGGIPGVRVGTQTYPASAVDRPRWQVVALSQRNLRPKWNRTYRDGDASVIRDLQSLQNDPVPSTVVITTFDRPGWVGFDPGDKSVAPVLSQLSLEIAPSSVQGTGTQGAFSAVVNVNGKQSSPQYRWGATAGSGGMVGLLVYDQYLDYRYVPNDRPTMDTRSPSSCDANRTSCHVGITTVDPRSSQAPGVETADSSGAAGFLVRVYGKLDLSVQERRTFVTGENQYHDGMVASEMSTFLSDLKRTHPGDLVVITTFRSPGAGHDVVVSKKVNWSTMLQLSKSIASVGGTRDVFNRAVGVAGNDYTLIGWTDPTPDLSIEGKGSESSGQDARLRAVLTRNQFSLLRPTNTSTELQPSDELPTVAWAPPAGTWPALNGDVIAYLQGSQEIKNTNHVLTADPRRQYWDDLTLKSGPARDGSAMAALATAVASVPPPTGAQPFTRDDFTRTQQRLHDEMVLVSHVRSNLNSLALPLDAVRTDYRDRISKVVDQIYSDAKSQQNAKFDWVGLFSAIVGIVTSMIPGIGPALNVAKDVATKLATALTAMSGLVQASAWGAAHTQNGPPAYDDFALKKDEITSYIGTTTEAAIANLSIMGDLIVADHSKLVEVASWCFDKADPVGVCGARDQHWVAAAAGALKRANDRAVFTQAAPLAYATYDLGPTYWTLVEPKSYLNEYTCYFTGARFTYAPADALVVLRQGDYVPHIYLSRDRDPMPEFESWTLWPTEQVYVMGLISGHSPELAGHDPTYPSADILARLFGPVLVDANPDAGGLGVAKATFIPGLPGNWTTGCGWSGQSGRGMEPYYAPGS